LHEKYGVSRIVLNPSGKQRKTLYEIFEISLETIEKKSLSIELFKFFFFLLKKKIEIQGKNSKPELTFIF
jgi:hypothetical protein